MNEKVALYEGPDAHNTCFDIPEGEIDVFNVVVGRRMEEVDVWGTPRVSATAASQAETVKNRDLAANQIVPGKGWEVWGEPQGECDGTYNSICARSGDNECVLDGHHMG